MTEFWLVLACGVAVGFVGGFLLAQRDQSNVREHEFEVLTAAVQRITGAIQLPGFSPQDIEQAREDRAALYTDTDQEDVPIPAYLRVKEKAASWDLNGDEGAEAE